MRGKEKCCLGKKYLAVQISQLWSSGASLMYGGFVVEVMWKIYKPSYVASLSPPKTEVKLLVHMPIKVPIAELKVVLVDGVYVGEYRAASPSAQRES